MSACPDDFLRVDSFFAFWYRTVARHVRASIDPFVCVRACVRACVCAWVTRVFTRGSDREGVGTNRQYHQRNKTFRCRLGHNACFYNSIDAVLMAGSLWCARCVCDGRRARGAKMSLCNLTIFLCASQYTFAPNQQYKGVVTEGWGKH